jgi:hypothetical protein
VNNVIVYDQSDVLVGLFGFPAKENIVGILHVVLSVR